MRELLDLATPFVNALGIGCLAVGVYLFASGWIRSPLGRALVLGTTCAVGGVFSMLAPVMLSPGVVVDGRATFVVVASFFGGPVAGMLTGAAVAAMRFDIGGVGAWPAMLTIAILVAAGAIVHLRCVRLDARLGVHELAIMAGCTLLANAAGILNLPAESDPFGLAARVLLPVTAANVIGLCFCGALLIEGRRREDERWRFAELADRFEAMTRIDALTGIANRRHFDEAIATEWNRAVRRAEPLSLLLLDIDRFKQFNDRYGHPAGDRCLALFARTIAKTVRRPEDVVVRYGGEEFALLLPGTDAVGAETVAAAILMAVRQAAMPHEDGIGRIVTASIGSATVYPEPDSTAATLIAAADSALYAAKQGGRDRHRAALKPENSVETAQAA